MEIIINEKTGYSVVCVSAPRLDVGSAADFKEKVSPVVKQGSRVVLDLAEVPFIDSTGLGTLLSLLRQLTELGGALKLSGLTDQVLNMFLLVRMNKVFDIYSDIGDAEHEWKN